MIARCSLCGSWELHVLSSNSTPNLLPHLNRPHTHFQGATEETKTKLGNRKMWYFNGEGSMLDETTEGVALPMDMQSKNSMVDVARNKAAIDYCAYLSAVFHIRVCLWWDSRSN
jgi:hypothetical protein